MEHRAQDLPLDPAALRGASEKLLRELYFNSLGGGVRPMAPAMALALQANFGSVERWREEFIAMGQALGGGSGWVLLLFQPREGTLLNRCAAGHAQALAGGIPLLALDMLEQARQLDVGAAADRQVAAFLENIPWDAVYERYQLAVHEASEPYGAPHDALAGALVLDVRRAGVFEAATTLLAGARWLDPAQVGSWGGDLPTEREIVVYCVHGHEVSRATALRLRAAGLRARYLRGGLDGWQAAGRPVEPK